MPLRGFLVVFGIFAVLGKVDGCAAQYRKELRYLDYYLGISPANEEGKIPTNEVAISRYAEEALDLNCDLRSACLWSNAPSDELLDTSDFYLFNKTDKKTFPIQIRPGDANPDVGSLFLLAGNTTATSQSAVLLSAPITCQNSEGVLTFKYWLYNSAKVEVLLLRVNEWHNRLQVMSRPSIDCHFLKVNGVCRVEIDRMTEPFKIGIRLFSLKDPSVGSFGMINDIHYKANLCGAQDKPSLFGDQLLNRPLSRIPITTGAQLNCYENITNCLWATASSIELVNSDAWRVGTNIRRWEDVIRLPSKPNGDFVFQYVDPMSRLPLPRLRSVFVPCTQTSASLSFRYWMSPGVQAQVCSTGMDNVVLSCVYLDVADTPGPVTVDIDSPDGQPFAFFFEIISFSKASGGVMVIDDIEFRGVLCSETLLTTTLSPLSRAARFDLQSFPDTGPIFSDSLNCDFETDLCSHWTHSESGFMYGNIPPLSDINSTFRGNAAVALFPMAGGKTELSSQLVSCSRGGRFMVEYFSSPNATVSICANDRCVPQREAFGELAVNLTSSRPFRIRVLAESTDEAFVIVKRMSVSDDGFCPLETPSKLACKALKCSFKGGRLCGYRSVLGSPEDGAFDLWAPEAANGAFVRLDGNTNRAVLRSPAFELSSPLELRFEASLSTFGARLYICPDENSDLSNCELVLGPKAEHNRLERILVQLDPDIRQFAFVAVHDKFEQFGAAELLITRIELTDSDGTLIC